jgi:hypothetical protein
MNTAGIDWMARVNSATALLKKRRAAAILVSSALSSPCSDRKFVLAFEVPDRALRQREQPPGRARELRLRAEAACGPCAGDGALRRPGPPSSVPAHARVALHRLDQGFSGSGRGAASAAPHVGPGMPPPAAARPAGCRSDQKEQQQDDDAEQHPLHGRVLPLRRKKVTPASRARKGCHAPGGTPPPCGGPAWRR